MKYTFYCPILNHREQGETTTITIGTGTGTDTAAPATTGAPVAATTTAPTT